MIQYFLEEPLMAPVIAKATLYWEDLLQIFYNAN